MVTIQSYVRKIYEGLTHEESYQLQKYSENYHCRLWLPLYTPKYLPLAISDGVKYIFVLYPFSSYWFFFCTNFPKLKKPKVLVLVTTEIKCLTYFVDNFINKPLPVHPEKKEYQIYRQLEV